MLEVIGLWGGVQRAVFYLVIPRHISAEEALAENGVCEDTMIEQSTSRAACRGGPSSG